VLDVGHHESVSQHPSIRYTAKSMASWRSRSHDSTHMVLSIVNRNSVDILTSRSFFAHTTVYLSAIRWSYLTHIQRILIVCWSCISKIRLADRVYSIHQMHAYKHSCLALQNDLSKLRHADKATLVSWKFCALLLVARCSLT
jgi:hypothetical protein